TGFLFPLFPRSFFCPPGSFIIRKDIAQTTRFDPVLEPCEDYDFLLRASLFCKKAIYVPMPVVQHRIHASNTAPSEFPPAAARTADKLRSIFSCHPQLSHRQRGRAIADVFLGVADGHYSQGMRRRAAVYYLRALYHSPAALFTRHV